MDFDIHALEGRGKCQEVIELIHAFKMLRVIELHYRWWQITLETLPGTLQPLISTMYVVSISIHPILTEIDASVLQVWPLGSSSHSIVAHHTHLPQACESVPLRPIHQMSQPVQFIRALAILPCF